MSRRSGNAIVHGIAARLGAALWLCALAAGRADAAAISWNGNTSTEWNLGSNWSSGNIPGSGDDVTIPANVASGRYPIVSTANANAKTVTMAAGAGTAPSLTVSAQQLTVAGNFTVTNGTVTISGGTVATTGGAVSITGTVNLSSGTWLCSVTQTINSGGNLNVSGTGVLHMATAIGTSPTDNVVIAVGGTLTQSGGTVDIHDLTTNPGPPDGTYNQSGGTLNSYHNFKNTGTFNATGGTVVFNTGAIAQGTWGTTQFFNVTNNADPGYDVSAVSFGVAGDWTSNVAVDLSSKATVATFNGTGSQTIGGTSTTTFANVTINCSGTVTLGATETVKNGNLTVTAGILDLSSSTMNRSAAGGTITVSNGATLKIGGTNSFPTNYTTHTLGATSTVEYEGTNQTVTNETYGHLTLSGSGTKTMPNGTLAIAGNFTMSGTPSATALAAINTTGSFTVGNGCTFTTGAFTHDIKGDFSNSGTFTATGSTITLDGTSDQNVGGTATTTFNNLTINKASTKVVENTTFNVSGTLTFTAGNINTGANKVVITSTGAVSQTSGWVNGNLQKNVATGTNVSRTFEIGGATSYRPVTVVFASVSAAGDLMASNTAGDHPNIASSDVNPNKSVNRYWTLTNVNTLAYTTFGATFTFVAGDVDAGATTANFIVRRWSGSAWSTTTIGARTATTTQITGQATVGDFQIGDVLSVASSTGTFAFGTQPLNAWLTPQSSVITNDGTETEAIVAQLSTLSAGANTWTLSTSVNGADQTRAQWSTTSSTGPWTDVTAYGSNFTISSTLGAGGTVTLWVRIQTPTTSASLGPYSSNLTLTAQ